MWTEYRLDDGSMVVLPHPIEEYEIERHGTTLERAMDQLRLYQGRDWACNDCGRLCAHVVQFVPGKVRWRAGYTRAVLWAEVAGIVAIGVYELAFGLGRSYGLMCPTMCVFGVSLVVLFSLEMRAEGVRWKGRYAPPPPAACPSCGGADMWQPGEVVQGWRYPQKWSAEQTLPPSAERRLVCAQCGRAELEQVGSWIS